MIWMILDFYSALAQDLSNDPYYQRGKFMFRRGWAIYILGTQTVIFIASLLLIPQQKLMENFWFFIKFK